MPKKEYKVKGTDKQKRVIKKTSENFGNKKVKSKGQILLESGYSRETSENPSTIYESKGVKQGLKPIIDKWKEERDRLSTAMSERDLNEVEYKKLADVIDILTKNIQLLSGKETERKILVLPSEAIDKYNLKDEE